MGRPILELTIHFVYLLEIRSLELFNVPYLRNAAVKWFHMKSAYNMGCPL